MTSIDDTARHAAHACGCHWPERVTRRHIDLQLVASAICRTA